MASSESLACEASLDLRYAIDRSDAFSEPRLSRRLINYQYGARVSACCPGRFGLRFQQRQYLLHDDWISKAGNVFHVTTAMAQVWMSMPPKAPALGESPLQALRPRAENATPT